MKNTLENNKLIADFMGIEYGPGGYINNPNSMQFKPDCTFLDGIVEAENLRFSVSWEWLLPVVERISSQKFEDGDSKGPRTFGLRDFEGLYMVRFNRMGLVTDKSFINAVYRAVIEVIRLNNNQL